MDDLELRLKLSDGDFCKILNNPDYHAFRGMDGKYAQFQSIGREGYWYSSGYLLSEITSIWNSETKMWEDINDL